MAKKMAARVRPARSESESDVDGLGKSKGRSQEDTTNIIQFNCAEVLDFSTGSVVLPLRITCYCRHHREKVGFNVHFTMMDHEGRTVGRGMTKPIMITDDHKTSSTNKNSESPLSFPSLDHSDWSQVRRISNEASPSSASSRRKGDSEGGGKSTKKRHKPYDASTKLSRAFREGSVSSAPSPAIHSPASITRASTPSSFQNNVTPDPIPASQPPPLLYTVQGSDTSSPDSLTTPLDHSSDVPMPPISFDFSEMQPDQLRRALHPPLLTPNLSLANLPHSLPFMTFDPHQLGQQMHMQAPIIHRLIPGSGPTYGGIEVTVLGANFHSTIPLTCKFGDVAASFTQRWSDNTLVCVLPASATPGVVPVWFDGFAKPEDSLPSPVFTYLDESDRTL